MNERFAAFVKYIEETGHKCFEFDPSFLDKWEQVLLGLEGKSTGAAIDELVESHHFYVSEAKMVVVALRDSGTVRFSDEAYR